MYTDFSNIHARPIMHTPYRAHLEFIKKPVFDHGFAAAPPFFGRLKHKINRSIKIACFSKILRRPQQHRAMAIMPTCVHPSGGFRFMRKCVHFLHRQGIHIRPQANRGIRMTIAAQYPNDTCLAHAAMHLYAE